jgi:kinesin family protein 2/24
MGNANSAVFETQDCHDSASRRQNNRSSFEAGVQALREELKPGVNPRPVPLPRRSSDKGGRARPCVVVRKRPLFEHERQRDFDVLSCEGGTDVWGDRDAAAMWVTRSMLCADHKTMYTENHCFYCDAVFDEHASTIDVYASAVRPLVEDAFGPRNGSATVLCFGQTGSGKTYAPASPRAACVSAI